MTETTTKLSHPEQIVADFNQYVNGNFSFPEKTNIKETNFIYGKKLIQFKNEIEEFLNEVHDECEVDKVAIFKKSEIDSSLPDYQICTPNGGNPHYVHTKAVQMFELNANMNAKEVPAFARLWLLLFPDSKLGDLIFISDKLTYSKKIGYDEIIFYRASDFTISKDSGTFLRFNGGNKGNGKYGSDLRKENKGLHLPNLRYAFNGNVKMDIKCFKTGEYMENISLSNHSDPSSPYIRDIAVDWHHVKYTLKKSDSKEGEPSKKFLKKTLTEKEWLEIFTCIPLRQDMHTLVHIKTTGDANDWIKWTKDGNASGIPYVWQSEAKFNKVCKKLNLVNLKYEDLVNRLFYIDETISYSEAVAALKSCPKT